MKIYSYKRKKTKKPKTKNEKQQSEPQAVPFIIFRLVTRVPRAPQIECDFFHRFSNWDVMIWPSVPSDLLVYA